MMARSQFFFKHILTLTTFLCITSSIYGAQFEHNEFYVSATFGSLSADMGSQFIDKSDVIPQNVSGNYNQTGYMSGVGIGYIFHINPKYFLGASLTQNFGSSQNTFYSGAATTAFSDTTTIKNTLTFIIQPGFMATDSIASYINMGIASSGLEHTLVSPQDTTPSLTTYNQQKQITGFVFGLGVRNYLTESLSVFAEYNSYDYNKVNFNDFQNFTATYSQSTIVSMNTFNIGANWRF